MYKKISKKWSNPRIQKFFNNNRNKINDLYFGEKVLLDKYLEKNSTVLDIGCGNGGFFNILKKLKKNVQYAGLDFNEKMIFNAKKKFPNLKFYHYEDIKYKIYLKKKFDYVLIFGVLHLNNNWKKILINAKKIIKKGIFFDIRCSEQNSARSIKKSYFQLGKKKGEDIIPYNVLNFQNFKNFLKKNFKNFDEHKISYPGKPSSYAKTQLKKITFENYFLRKK